MLYDKYSVLLPLSVTAMSKITKLLKIPHLLNKKKEAEHGKRRKEKENEERPPFNLLDRPPLERPKLVSFPKRTHSHSEEEEKQFNAWEGVGDRLDIKI